jgi:hypothetical protein
MSVNAIAMRVLTANGLHRAAHFRVHAGRCYPGVEGSSAFPLLFGTFRK